MTLSNIEAVSDERLAEFAADACGVTSHSDMRPFVVQAVKYALSRRSANSAGGDWASDVTPEAVQIMRSAAEPYLRGADFEQVDPPVSIAGGVEVKALIWEEDEPGWWCAQPAAMIGGFGYEVRITDRGSVRYRRGQDDWAAFDGTLEQAKAAAQADFNQRILSAIVSSPVSAEVTVDAEPLAKLAWTAVQSAAEWDDRTSPDGYEDYLFFKPDELHGILVSIYETVNDAVSAEVTEATHRHVKRGSEYVLIGFGKMQAEDWRELDWATGSGEGEYLSVDMREVAIYRSVDDGSLWARPREEFEDGRFVSLSALNGGRENG